MDSSLCNRHCWSADGGEPRVEEANDEKLFPPPPHRSSHPMGFFYRSTFLSTYEENQVHQL